MWRSVIDIDWIIDPGHSNTKIKQTLRKHQAIRLLFGHHDKHSAVQLAVTTTACRAIIELFNNFVTTPRSCCCRRHSAWCRRRSQRPMLSWQCLLFFVGSACFIFIFFCLFYRDYFVHVQAANCLCQETYNLVYTRTHTKVLFKAAP